MTSWDKIGELYLRSMCQIKVATGQMPLLGQITVWVFVLSGVGFSSLVVAWCVSKHVFESVGLSQKQPHLLIAPVYCGKVLQEH